MPKVFTVPRRCHHLRNPAALLVTGIEGGPAAVPEKEPALLLRGCTPSAVMPPTAIMLPSVCDERAGLGSLPQRGGTPTSHSDKTCLLPAAWPWPEPAPTLPRPATRLGMKPGKWEPSGQGEPAFPTAGRVGTESTTGNCDITGRCLGSVMLEHSKSTHRQAVFRLTLRRAAWQEGGALPGERKRVECRSTCQCLQKGFLLPEASSGPFYIWAL